MPKPTAKDLRALALHERVMRRIERPYSRAIKREKNRYVRATAESYDIANGLSVIDFNIHAENMYKISELYNVKAIRAFAILFQNEYIKSISLLEAKQTAFDNFINGLFQYWIVNQTGKDAKETAQTTQDDIKKAIAAARLSGETSSIQIAKKILKVRNLSPFRAEVIARTETHNAAMYATKESANKLQVDTGELLNKKWVPVQDSRTRDRHSAMANHDAIPLGDKFNVGVALMDRPGDPSGGASNVIQCRCTVVFEVL